MIRTATIVLAAATLAAAAEPAPKTLTPMPLKFAASIGHVSAVMELPDGRLLVSDAKAPRVSIVDTTGNAHTIGGPGSGDGKYAQPGGFYRRADGTIQLMDRAGSHVLVLSPNGDFVRAFSAAERGITRSSDADVDFDQLDDHGNAYHASMSFAGGVQGRNIVRLDPSTQQKTIVAALGLPETRTVAAGNGMTLSAQTVGSPADDWGLAPDGRVAIVRGKPYRVEWLLPGGKTVTGPEIAVDDIPFTDADKKSIEEKNSKDRVGVGIVGSGSSASALPTKYAASKAPFSAGNVFVSPSNQVWIMRSMPFGATTVIYDVFDATGARIHRFAVPADSRIVGFGAGSVFMREGHDDGPEVLRKYRVQ